jgi:hypothetical protein
MVVNRNLSPRYYSKRSAYFDFQISLYSYSFQNAGTLFIFPSPDRNLRYRQFLTAPWAVLSFETVEKKLIPIQPHHGQVNAPVPVCLPG